MNRTLLQAGCILGFFAVAIGAFGAHGLEGKLSPDQLQTYETGVKYQFYHALAIVLVAGFTYFSNEKLLNIAGWIFFAGICCFSGSIYLLACRDLLGIQSWTWLGPVTPLGGVLFLTGWTMLIVAAGRMGVK